MRKLLAAVVFLMFVKSGGAEVVDIDVVTTLLDHVSTVTQFKSGETSLALMDSVVQIGRSGGYPLLSVQAGVSGNTKPEQGQVQAANFLVGGYLSFKSLNKYVMFPDHWKFLNSLEHGVAYVWDFREKRDFICYQAGLSFSLNPK